MPSTPKRSQLRPPDPPPDALRNFMMANWKPTRRKVVTIKASKHHAARRKALSERFPKRALLIPTGHERTRSNDTTYRFRPGSDFFWLTGNMEPDCVLLLLPTQRGHRSVLFVEPNPGKTSDTFFTDRRKGELWVGPRLGVEQSRIRFGVDEIDNYSIPVYFMCTGTKQLILPLMLVHYH